MNPLEVELAAALKATSPEATTLALCRAWAVCRSTRLARLARGFARLSHHAPVEGANEDAREEAWVALAKAGRPEDTDTLLATPWSKRPKRAVQRLRTFAARGPDPRVVGHLLELDTGNRFNSAAGFRFWFEAYELLLSWGAPEVLERLAEKAPGTAWVEARQREIFAPLRAGWAGRLPAEPALDEPIEDLVAALERRLAPSVAIAGSLLSAVQQHPEDDAARLVLADALTERGDPRGEFIALQFAHARGELTMGRREHMQRLLSAAGVRWFDGLEQQVGPVALFEKGFLSEVALQTRGPDPSLPAWRTVEALHVGGVALALSSFLSHPNLARVHTLRSAWGGTLEELARHGDARTFALLEVSQLGARELAPPAWRARQLRLLADIDQAVWWFSAGALAESVDELSLQLKAERSFERVGAALEELQAQDIVLQAVEFTAKGLPWPRPWVGDWSLRFEADRDGRFSRLVVTLGEEHLHGLERALASLPNALLRSLEVRTLQRQGPAWRDSARLLLERALSNQRWLKARTLNLEKPVKLPPRPVLFSGA